MPKPLQNKAWKRGWLALRRLPLFPFIPFKISFGPKRNRTYKLILNLTRSRVIEFRLNKYKSKSAKRSSSSKQTIIPLSFNSNLAIKLTPRRRKKLPLVMPSKRWTDPKLIIIDCLILLGLAGTLYFGIQFKKPSSVPVAQSFSVAIPTPSTKTVKAFPRSIPTHLSIPSVGIDSDVISVGQNSDGTLETPPVLSWVTGWYKYGPTPGELGPAVIVGHVDSYKGISVFWRLREVKAGDQVSVTRADGKIIKFKVEALKQFDQDNFPTQEVYGNIDHAGLRLITCGGTFNTSTGHYNQNTVVFASMIS